MDVGAKSELPAAGAHGRGFLCDPARQGKYEAPGQCRCRVGIAGLAGIAGALVLRTHYHRQTASSATSP
jgi:hypothetical protein